MFRTIVRLAIAASFAMPVAASATVAIYSVAGTGEGRLINFHRTYLSDGNVVDSYVNTLLGEGAFTASYRIDLARLPANQAVPGSGYLGAYQSDGPPQVPFLTSTSSAVVAGQHFGLTTTGDNYHYAADGTDLSLASDILIGAGTDDDVITEVRGLDGRLISSTQPSVYNQLYAYWGGSHVVDGVSLPGFASGASLQIIRGATTVTYNPDGSLASYEFGYRQFIGNGAVSFSLANGVPEPASWALMIGGFGVVGAAARRRRVAVAA